MKFKVFGEMTVRIELEVEVDDTDEDRAEEEAFEIAGAHAFDSYIDGSLGITHFDERAEMPEIEWDEIDWVNLEKLE